jgi:hypothetical protein
MSDPMDHPTTDELEAHYTRKYGVAAPSPEPATGGRKPWPKSPIYVAISDAWSENMGIEKGPKVCRFLHVAAAKIEDAIRANVVQGPCPHCGERLDWLNTGAPFCPRCNFPDAPPAAPRAEPGEGPDRATISHVLSGLHVLAEQDRHFGVTAETCRAAASLILKFEDALAATAGGQPDGDLPKGVTDNEGPQ